MNWNNLIITIILLLCLGYVYNKFKLNLDKMEMRDDLNLIQKYLLGYTDENDIINLGTIKKPILWIHIEYNYNSRNWCNFGSRSSMELNMPYIYLTIQSIINNCGDDFHICLIDDFSFKKLLPEYNIDLTRVSNPVKQNLRNLALLRVIHMYGGVLLENSFICFKSIKPLYDKAIETNIPIVGEFINTSYSNELEVYTPSSKLIGCVKECPVIKKLIEYLDVVNNTDFTAEQNFNNKLQEWLNNNLSNFMLVSAELLGTRSENNLVTIEKLLTNDKLTLDNNIFMLYVPRDEILKRTRYNWATRMNHKQILESNTNLGKYLLISNN